MTRHFATARNQCSISISSRNIHTASRRSRTISARPIGKTYCGMRASARPVGACGGRLHASTRRDRRLRHGDHPTPARHCKRAADGEFVAAARQFRQACGGDLPGAWPFERTRRSHNGHRREAKAGTTGSAKKAFGFEPPRAHGGNFVRAVPDWTVAEAAMRRLRLTVAVSTKLNRGHLVHGEEALILPALARSDIDMQAGGRQSITVEDSMSMVHASSGLVQPPSDHLIRRLPSSAAWRKPRCPIVASTGTCMSQTTTGSATRSKRCFPTCLLILMTKSV